MAKDRDMEWRLVATKGRESCRWQAADTSWVALSLGFQGDITKVVVTASDGRSETVEGYEQGLNLARRWRTEWQHDGSGPTMSSKSGPWLPPLPGHTDSTAGGSSDELVPTPADHGRSSGPSTAPNPATSPGSMRHRSVPPGVFPHSSSPSPAPAKGLDPGSPGSIHSGAALTSRVSQRPPVSRASHAGTPLPSAPSSSGGISASGGHPVAHPSASASGIAPIPPAASSNPTGTAGVHGSSRSLRGIPAPEEPPVDSGAKPDSNPPKFPRR